MFKIFLCPNNKRIEKQKLRYKDINVILMAKIADILNILETQWWRRPPDSAQIPSLMPHMESYLCQCYGHHYHFHTRKRLSIRMWIYKGRTTCATSTARFFFPTVLSSLKVLSVTLMTSSSGCCSLVTKSCLLFCDPHGLQPTRLLCPWDFPGKDTGVGCHFLLQGNLPKPEVHLATIWSVTQIQQLVLQQWPHSCSGHSWRLHQKGTWWEALSWSYWMFMPTWKW